MWELLENRHWWSQVRQVRLRAKRKRGKVRWKSTFIARLMAGIALTTLTPPFLASVLWKTLCTSVMTSRWCGTRVMTTSVTESAEVVKPATTPTKTQPTKSHSATAVIITTITVRGLRINLSLFGVPQTGVPARISICQGISTFFCENAAGANIRSVSRIQRAGAGGLGPIFRPVYPICKFFTTSSDLSYALNFPVKLGPPEGRPGIRICAIYKSKMAGRMNPNRPAYYYSLPL